MTEKMAAAAEVVRARYEQKEWEPLKDAIAALAGILEKEPNDVNNG